MTTKVKTFLVEFTEAELETIGSAMYAVSYTHLTLPTINWV